MFDPFFTTKPTGTGLGLLVCKQIADQHGGVLTARNNDGPGATIELRLPTGTAPTTHNG